jgi:hypothetical protein
MGISQGKEGDWCVAPRQSTKCDSCFTSARRCVAGGPSACSRTRSLSAFRPSTARMQTRQAAHKRQPSFVADASCVLSQMFEKIKSAPLRFPKFMSQNYRALVLAVSARALQVSSCRTHRARLLQLLQRDPAKRCGSLGEIDDVKKLAIFEGLDWDAYVPARACRRCASREPAYGRRSPQPLPQAHSHGLHR